jgi:hypothetical protein
MSHKSKNQRKPMSTIDKIRAERKHSSADKMAQAISAEICPRDVIVDWLLEWSEFWTGKGNKKLANRAFECADFMSRANTTDFNAGCIQLAQWIA